MDAASEDYYEILGISRTASTDEVKKGYRKLALRWHPDKNLNDRENAERMFKRVAEAYEVLSNAEKRSVYDRLGKEGLEQDDDDGDDESNDGHGEASQGARDAFSVFNEFFGGQDPFAEMDTLFGEGFGSEGFSKGFEDDFFTQSFGTGLSSPLSGKKAEPSRGTSERSSPSPSASPTKGKASAKQKAAAKEKSSAKAKAKAKSKASAKTKAAKVEKTATKKQKQ
eukprot:TRINITY_DN27741_c0_g1_i1.p1 TRINITY_DN27741_c0_g1~~TRINITY_DN27741_c0_g1_i1.p1  ORF type:complete len:225 (+),score=73.78 TRINITY_DN27741_c0_g1_i1:92-766(+)